MRLSARGCVVVFESANLRHPRDAYVRLLAHMTRPSLLSGQVATGGPVPRRTPVPRCKGPAVTSAGRRDTPDGGEEDTGDLGAVLVPHGRSTRGARETDISTMELHSQRDEPTNVAHLRPAVSRIRPKWLRFRPTWHILLGSALTSSNHCPPLYQPWWKRSPLGYDLCLYLIHNRTAHIDVIPLITTLLHTYGLKTVNIL